MKLLDHLRELLTPEPMPEPERLPAPVNPFADCLAETYTATRQRFPFLPASTDHLEHIWQTVAPAARAVFVLDYVTRVYAGVAAHVAQREAAGLPQAPTLVLRTPDHPEASTRPAGTAPTQDAYAIWFDTDTGARVEVHMGPVIFASFRALAQDWPTEGRRAS